jgi:hypothetical protein
MDRYGPPGCPPPGSTPPGSTPRLDSRLSGDFPLPSQWTPGQGCQKWSFWPSPRKPGFSGYGRQPSRNLMFTDPFSAKKGPKPGIWAPGGPPSQGSFHYESMLCKHRFVMKWPLGPVLGAILDHFLTHFWVIFGPFFGPPFGRSLAGSLLLGVGNGPKPLKKGSQNGPQKGPKMGQNGHFPLSQAMRGQKGSFWAILAIWTILAILTHI